MEKLYLVWTLDTDKDFTLALSDPKPDLTGSVVSPVMQTAVTNSLISYNGAKLKAVKDAYYRTVTTTPISGVN